MIRQLFRMAGYDYVVPSPVNSIPFDRAALCMDCDTITQIDKHGRCAVCKSDAVLMVRESVLGGEGK